MWKKVITHLAYRFFSAGNAYKWARDTFCSDLSGDQFDQMNSLAALSPVRANGVMFNPSLADVSQGTFTISNLGSFGIEQFTAILNPGQTGILAIGATQPEAVVVENEIVIRPIMRMTLAVDHRVVDGSLAAQFSATLRKAIENPGLIIW